jgi:hypothetical protein
MKLRQCFLKPIGGIILRQFQQQFSRLLTPPGHLGRWVKFNGNVIVYVVLGRRNCWLGATPLYILGGRRQETTRNIFSYFLYINALKPETLRKTVSADLDK